MGDVQYIFLKEPAHISENDGLHYTGAEDVRPDSEYNGDGTPNMLNYMLNHFGMKYGFYREFRISEPMTMFSLQK